MNILTYLDNQIETFRQKNNHYPSKIIMDKETKNKIFAELKSEPTMDSCWKEKNDNYRGILIEIRDVDFLKLEE